MTVRSIPSWGRSSRTRSEPAYSIFLSVFSVLSLFKETILSWEHLRIWFNSRSGCTLRSNLKRWLFIVIVLIKFRRDITCWICAWEYLVLLRLNWGCLFRSCRLWRSVCLYSIILWVVPSRQLLFSENHWKKLFIWLTCN